MSSCDPGNMTSKGRVRPKVISDLGLAMDLNPRTGIQHTKSVKHSSRNSIYMVK